MNSPWIVNFLGCLHLAFLAKTSQNQGFVPGTFQYTGVVHLLQVLAELVWGLHSIQDFHFQCQVVQNLFPSQVANQVVEAMDVQVAVNF